MHKRLSQGSRNDVKVEWFVFIFACKRINLVQSLCILIDKLPEHISLIQSLLGWQSVLLRQISEMVCLPTNLNAIQSLI